MADGDIHWFIVGGDIGPSNGGSDAASMNLAWVTSNFASVNVEGTTLYDLTQPLG